ncbi:MAG: spondin domain-containing protein [Deltaproteobacteria bacterium]|nr:spondin domain-containing protein [Deltaproteobacteria bacterium]
MPLRRLAAIAFCLVVTAQSPVYAGTGTMAQCNLRFDATWSAATHPTDFPLDPHFSGLIGGTHNLGISFWEPGGLATPGIKLMAETGAKTLLQEEVEDAIQDGFAADLVSGGGIGVSPGMVSVSFDIDLAFPYLTVVSMIAPSPDWFVGIHGLSLLRAGRWIDQDVIDLPPYDAGTDSGVTYDAPDLVTIPSAPIAQITGFPFGGATSLGTLTIDCTSSLVFADGFENGNTDTWTTTVP